MKKYFELRPDASGAQVYWSLRGEWYAEGELYDRDGHYEQRKVILTLLPGEFLLLPAELPSSCAYTLVRTTTLNAFGPHLRQ